MGGPTRRRIFGDRVRSAKISADDAACERAREATREADAAECVLWSEQMEGFSRHRRSRNASEEANVPCGEA